MPLTRSVAVAAATLPCSAVCTASGAPVYWAPGVDTTTLSYLTALSHASAVKWEGLQRGARRQPVFAAFPFAPVPPTVLPRKHRDEKRHFAHAERVDRQLLQSQEASAFGEAWEWLQIRTGQWPWRNPATVERVHEVRVRVCCAFPDAMLALPNDGQPPVVGGRCTDCPATKQATASNLRNYLVRSQLDKAARGFILWYRGAITIPPDHKINACADFSC